MGIFEKLEITPLTVRMRVQVNGLLPLLMESIIEYSNGDDVRASFVYENLERHCSKCFCLDHELRDCLVAKHEQKKLKEQQELANIGPDSRATKVHYHQDHSEVFRFSAQRPRDEHTERYHRDQHHYERRGDARKFINENRRYRLQQAPSRRSQNSYKAMEWRAKDQPSHSIHQKEAESRLKEKDYSRQSTEHHQSMRRRSPPESQDKSLAHRNSETKRA